jgi:hypothetical protein
MAISFGAFAPALEGLLDVFRKRPRLAVGILAALIVLFAALALLMVFSGARGGSGDGQAAAQGAAMLDDAKLLPIPADEIFLPPEPDYLPLLLLGRNRRELWTAKDARPYWIDPAPLMPDSLKDEAQNVITTLLEAVP